MNTNAEKLGGIIILDKPLGKTSHDMVYFMRRLLNMKKVGHTGTLDPDATGVLPICFGHGTKVADLIMATDKEYISTVKLGITTDTQDKTGTVIKTRPVAAGEKDIISAVNSFLGEYEQMPPMYSAIKINGQKLYNLARQGIEVARKARNVQINAICAFDINLEESTFKIKVNVSKGTYIRTLAVDIGEKLGCGAHITDLRRTKTGIFDIENTFTTDTLLNMKENGNLEDAIVPIDDVFVTLPAIILDKEEERKFKNGIQIPFEKVIMENDINDIDGRMYRVYNMERTLMAIAEKNGSRIKIKTTFWG